MTEDNKPSWNKATCYEKRDIYTNCYLKHRSEPMCTVELEDMFASCPRSWAKFFKGKALRVKMETELGEAVDEVNQKMGSAMPSTESVRRKMAAGEKG
eukprot:sb/3478946/